MEFVYLIIGVGLGLVLRLGLGLVIKIFWVGVPYIRNSLGFQRNLLSVSSSYTDIKFLLKPNLDEIRKINLVDIRLLKKLNRLHH